MSAVRQRSYRFTRVLAMTLGVLATVPPAAGGESRTEPSDAAVRRLLDDGRYAAAESAALKLLQHVERGSPRDTARLVRAMELELEALVLAGRGCEAETGKLAKRLERLAERAFGADDPRLASGLLALTRVRFSLGDYVGSLDLAQRAVALRARAASDSAGLAEALVLQARSEIDLGRYARAESLATLSALLNERVFGPEHRSVAVSLIQRSRAQAFAARHAAARAGYARAIEIRERVLGPTHPETGESHYAMGWFLWRVGELDSSRTYFERAIAVREETLGPDHPDLATTWFFFGALEFSQARYEEARAKYERALAIREKSLGPDHVDVARTLGFIGQLETAVGDLAGARRSYERALAIRRRVCRPDDPEIAWGLNGLAWVLFQSGDDARAEELYREGLRLMERVRGEEHLDLVQFLHGVGNSRVNLGDAAGGLPHLRRALAIREKLLGPDRTEVAGTLINLGNALSSSGDLPGGASAYRRALTIFETRLGPEHDRTLSALHNLALAHARLGDLDSARTLADRACAGWEAELGPTHPSLARSLAVSAIVAASQGDTARTLELALRAENIGRDHLRHTARGLSEREALRYAAIRPSGLNVALMLAERGLSPTRLRDVWNAVIASRALVLDEIGSRHRRVSDIGRRAQAVTDASAALANLTVQGRGNESAEDFQRRLEVARLQKERAERELAETSLEYRNELELRHTDVSRLSAALPRGSALVAFVRFEAVSFAESALALPGGKWSSEGEYVTLPSYLALVLRSGARDPAVVPLGNAQRVDSLVASWAGEAARGAHVPPKWLREAPYRRSGEQLRRAIWDPLASAIGDAARVFVVPDGALHLVNLAALPTGDAEYLVETGPLLHILSTERDVARRQTAELRGGLLLVGGPDFERAARTAASDMIAADAASSSAGGGEAAYRGTLSGCADFKSLRWEALPGTLEECQDLSRLWRSEADSTSASVTLLTGSRAEETRVKSLAPRSRILHLATHGFFLGGACGGSPESAPELESPLVLSGMALAGANRRNAAAAQQDDGVLTAEEIAALDLSGVEWAVLSACESGSGRIAAGEGVFGMRRAFEIAGARTLIMSLWAVEDDATRRWMQSLYRARLTDRLGTAESVRQASLEQLRARRERRENTHPFYWGAFVAAGDWR